MLQKDKIIVNGEATNFEDCGLLATRILYENYIYQQIHTLDHKALNVSEHLEILNVASQKIYGTKVDLSAEEISGNIEELLRMNRYSRDSNQVTIKLFQSDITGDAHTQSYLLEVTEQLLYSGYKVWHTRPTLDIFQCEYPYMGCTTAVSQLSARYSHEYAQRKGMDIAVIEKNNGTLTNVSDEPLFLLFTNELVTSPLSEGANDSVMRRLAVRAAASEGIKITEYPLRREMLKACDEAFTFSTQGIISVGGYQKTRYYNLMANRLITHFL